MYELLKKAKTKNKPVAQKMSITSFPGTIIPNPPGPLPHPVPALLAGAAFTFNSALHQAYGGPNTPEIHSITVNAPAGFNALLQSHVDKRASIISKVTSPFIAAIGNHVSQTLQIPLVTGWNTAANALAPNVVNPFNVLYKFPDIGVYFETEHHSSGSSYLRHSYIQQFPAQTEPYYEYFSQTGRERKSANTATYAADPLPPSSTLITFSDSRDKSYPEQHHSGKIISEELGYVNKYAGDSLSIATVEPGRFAFLRSIIDSVKMKDFLRFPDLANQNDKLIMLETLLKRFDNICKDIRGITDKQPGWEVYSITAAQVLHWMNAHPAGDILVVDRGEAPTGYPDSSIHNV